MAEGARSLVTESDAAPPSSTSLDRVKSEIEFFMEKTFQVSFGYLGALVAIGAAVNLEIIDKVADRLRMSPVPLACALVLSANVVYLSLAAGTLFATLKRGLYLVENHSVDSSHLRWESFLRDHNASVFRQRRLGFLAWNVDNFYMVPLFALIFAVSVVASVMGVASSDRTLDWIGLIALMALHAIPLQMLLWGSSLASHASDRARQYMATQEAIGE